MLKLYTHTLERSEYISMYISRGLYKMTVVSIVHNDTNVTFDILSSFLRIMYALLFVSVYFWVFLYLIKFQRGFLFALTKTRFMDTRQIVHG